jgi:SET domain-containing protein
MLIPVIIQPSLIEGLGIFAADHIAAGTILWKYQEPIDRKITGGCKVSTRWAKHLERYTYKPHGADFIILCGDAGMFWNHSDKPNCREADDTTIAARYIRIGEELTVDYRTFCCLPMPFLEKASG